MGGWFQKEINSLSDFQDLKMRIPGLGTEVINRLGGTAANLPGGEIMPALQSPVIDATEWVGPWNDLAFSFYRITKNYYGPVFHEPSATLELSVNKGGLGRARDRPADGRGECRRGHQRPHACGIPAANVESQRVLVEEYGVQIRPFPAEVFREMLRHSDDVVRATAQEDDPARRNFESWQRFRAYVYPQPVRGTGLPATPGLNGNRCNGGASAGSGSRSGFPGGAPVDGRP